MTNNKLTIAIATYKERISNALEIAEKNPTQQFLIVHQSDHASKSTMPKNVVYIHSTEYGISRSRNIALREVRSELLLFADDDIEYIPGFENNILDAFKENPSTDIAIFKIRGREEKKYPIYKTPHFFTRLKACSITIACRPDRIMEKRLSFDQDFGIGARYVSGEEHIFLNASQKKRLDILKVNKAIVIHDHESSGEKMNHDQFIAKIASFKKTHGPLSIFLSIPYFLIYKKLSKK